MEVVEILEDDVMPGRRSSADVEAVSIFFHGLRSTPLSCLPPSTMRVVAQRLRPLREAATSVADAAVQASIAATAFGRKSDLLVFRKGDRARSLYVVLLPNVVVRVYDERGTLFEELASPGQCFGWDGVVEPPLQHSFTARLEGPARGLAELPGVSGRFSSALRIPCASSQPTPSRRACGR